MRWSKTLRIVFALVGALLLPSWASSADFDAVSQASSNSTSLLSWTHTPTGTPTLVVVHVVYWEDTLGVHTITGVTYGGTAMTSAGTRVRHATGEAAVHLWYLQNPPSGNQTVEVDVNGANATAVTAGALTFTAAASVANYTSGTGSSADPTLTVTSATGEIVTGATGTFGVATMAFDTPATERWEQQVTDQDGHGGTEAGAASVTLDATYDDVGDWAMAALSVTHQAGVTAAPQRTLLGVGQ